MKKLTTAEVTALAMNLAEKISALRGYTAMYPIPRGGFPAAYAVLAITSKLKIGYSP